MLRYNCWNDTILESRLLGLIELSSNALGVVFVDSGGCVVWASWWFALGLCEFVDVPDSVVVVGDQDVWCTLCYKVS